MEQSTPLHPGLDLSRTVLSQKHKCNFITWYRIDDLAPVPVLLCSVGGPFPVGPQWLVCCCEGGMATVG